MTAKVTKLESACAEDVKKYCGTVTSGEGRIIYCMHAHEDKIDAKCAFELGETATSVQTAADALKDAVIACNSLTAWLSTLTFNFMLSSKLIPHLKFWSEWAGGSALQLPHNQSSGRIGRTQS
ncbi:hypothetical protein IVB22_15145 [Bradyrhizobium sp. 190]|nr:hypothetical protein [Bradyrhizobium sp. 190]